MILAEEKRQLQARVDEKFAQPSMTASERKQVDGWLSRIADIRSTEDRQARLEEVLIQTRRDAEGDRPEYQAAKIEGAFKRYVRGDKSQIRTYSPLSTAGVAVPQGFYADYSERLKSFSGIREVSTVITTSNGDPLKDPFADDTVNTAERLNENDLVSLANPTFNSSVFGAFRYASKGVQYSAALLQDAGIDVSEFLCSIFAKRVGRLTNSEFTLGAGGGPSGVIPAITNVQTAANSGAVGLADLVALQAVDAAYLPGATYMFAPSTERLLKKVLDVNGMRQFPEMNDKKLLGYPYVLNPDMPSVASSAKSVIFGNFKLGVAIREVVPFLLVSRERYAEFNMLYASLRHDQDCKVIDANALAVLQHP